MLLSTVFRCQILEKWSSQALPAFSGYGLLTVIFASAQIRNPTNTQKNWLKPRSALPCKENVEKSHFSSQSRCVVVNHPSCKCPPLNQMEHLPKVRMLLRTSGKPVITDHPTKYFSKARLSDFSYQKEK